MRSLLGAADRWALPFVIVIAIALRALVWKAMGGPLVRGDGASYVEWAQRLAAGDATGFQDYPLHQLYPLLLAPAYRFGLPFGLYTLVLHLALSLGTIACLYYVARRFASRRAALLAAAIAACYPGLLLWFPFVLSETPFFFFFSIFLASLTNLASSSTARRRARPIALFWVTSCLMLFARPVSVAALAVGIPVVAGAHLSDAFGPRRGRSIVAAGVAVVLIAAIGFFSVDTPLRAAVLRYPTVAQSLWLSTRFSASSTAEFTTVVREQQLISDRFGGNVVQFYEFKVRDATAFIGAHPVTYVGLAARRFTSYWFPSFFSDGWSTSHRIFDLLGSAALYIFTVVGLYGRRERVPWTLLAVALALGLLTSFSQIDTDGRYRVPAELALIPLAADGLTRSLARVFRPARSPLGPASR